MTIGSLELPEMAATGQREVIYNDGMAAIHDALTANLTIAVDDSNAYALPNADFIRNIFFILEPDTTPPDAGVTFEIPTTERGLFVVRNLTGQVVTVTIDSQSETPGTLDDGEIGKFICDGANVLLIAKGDGT